MNQYTGSGRWPDMLRDLRRGQQQMNRLFGGARVALTTDFPRVNVWAGPNGAIATAELPGVNPDEIDVTVHQDTTTLRGKRDSEAHDGEATVHRQERPHGEFARTVMLPFRVDASKVSARFKRGVLTLDLPRPEEDKPRQVKITHT